MTQDLGNTKAKSLKSRKWVFTLNNYSEEEYNSLESYLKAKGWKYIVGKEIGESKTEHLQGYIEAINAIRFETLKTHNSRFHLEKAKGSRDENITYCSKDNNFITNMEISRKPKDPLCGLTLKKWQEDILNIIKTEPDNRSIHWYWEKTGNTGKTTLAKHICLKYKNTLFCNGKGSDIKFAVYDYLENPDNKLDIIIFHFTRTVENFVSYEALESIKDGIFFNTKYKSGMCIFDTPHVICFANFEPCINKLSEDRWKIVEIF